MKNTISKKHKKSGLVTAVLVGTMYYNKMNTPGDTGNYGDKGFDGERGEPCYIKDSSCKFRN